MVDGPPRLVIRTCKHIQESGALCQAAAVGSRAYCRAHLLLGVRSRTMARARRRAACLKLPPMMDMAAVQVGAVRVHVALEAGHIEPGRARLLRSAMGMAATNLRFLQQQQGQSQRPFASSAKGVDRGKTEGDKSR